MSGLLPAMHAIESLATSAASPLRLAGASADARLERMRAHAASLARELESVEQVLLDGGLLTGVLARRRLVYVGGRPGSNAVLRELLRAAGGEFVHHVALLDDDGGARAQRFASMLTGADAVLCPLDTIDPESLAALRALCARHRVRWFALRTSSIASFIDGMLRAQRARRRAAAPTAVCPRHG